MQTCVVHGYLKGLSFTLRFFTSTALPFSIRKNWRWAFVRLSPWTAVSKGRARSLWCPIVHHPSKQKWKRASNVTGRAHINSGRARSFSSLFTRPQSWPFLVVQSVQTQKPWVQSPPFLSDTRTKASWNLGETSKCEIKPQKIDLRWIKWNYFLILSQVHYKNVSHYIIHCKLKSSSTFRRWRM